LFDYGYGEIGVDFPKQQTPCENIMTNPPFKISTDFTLHVLSLMSGQMLILHKLSFLEGKARRDRLFIQNKLKSVYVFSERLNFIPGSTSGGMMTFAWFLFDKQYNGDASIHWI